MATPQRRMINNSEYKSPSPKLREAKGRGIIYTREEIKAKKRKQIYARIEEFKQGLADMTLVSDNKTPTKFEIRQTKHYQ